MVEANLYVMFKVKKGEKMVTDWCVPKEQFRSFRGKQVILKFDQPQDEIKYETCCNENRLNFDVFVDLEDQNSHVKTIDNKFRNSVVDWYLGKYHIAGFKNYKFNGIPISDTWLNPSIMDHMISF